MKRILQVPEILEGQDYNSNGSATLRGVEHLLTFVALLGDDVDQAFVRFKQRADEMGLTALICAEADLLALATGIKLVGTLLHQTSVVMGRDVLDRGEELPTDESVMEWARADAEKRGSPYDEERADAALQKYRGKHGRL